MSLLQTAQNSWQNKVGEKDVDKFTVAGKMGGSTPNSKRPSRKESEMNAVNETHQPTVFFFLKIKCVQFRGHTLITLARFCQFLTN